MMPAVRRSDLLLVAATALGVVEVALDLSSLSRTALFALWSIVTLVATARDPRPILVVVCAVVMCAAAFVRTPESTDLWSYQAQGRAVAEYGENPYVATPADHPDDPVLQRVEFFYLGARSVYGPVFAVVAAVPAFLLDDGTRFVVPAWQLIAVASLVAMCWMLRRRGTLAVAALALSPLVVHHGIHLAHNDMLVALGLLAGCLLVERDRTTAAAVAFTLAGLVKVPAGLAVVTLVVWLLASQRRREAVRVAAVAAVCTIVSLLPFGPRATIDGVTSVADEINGLSIWNIARGDWRIFLWQSEPSGPPATPLWVTVISLGVPLAAAVFAAYRLRHRPFHEPLLAAMLCILVLAIRPASWLYLWVVPIAALVTSPRLRAAVLGYTLLFQTMAFAQLLPGWRTGSGDAPLQHLDAPVLGLTAIAGVALVWHLTVRTGRDAN